MNDVCFMATYHSTAGTLALRV